MRFSFTVIIGIILAGTLGQCKTQNMENYMIVGTYTNSGSKGLYVYKFNSQNGKSVLLSTSGTIQNPSYLTIHGDHVYAVSETNGNVPGSVGAYHFDRSKGELHLLNNLPTGGDDPCYLETDASGKFLAVANYSGGSVAVFPLGKDGALSGSKQLIQHEGGSVNPERQQGPHVHESVFSPDQKFLLTPDLGKDRVMIYQFNKDSIHPLTYRSEIVCDSGSGPRHITFHPNGKFAYLIHELVPSVTVFQYDNGNFREIQNVNVFPDSFSGKTDGAEVLVSPDGKFLYTSQRADQNTIGVFSIDQSTGKIQNIDYQPTGGKGPRYFVIDPTGNWLLVANQQSDNFVVFKRDKASGKLIQSDEIHLPVPVCIQFTGLN